MQMLGGTFKKPKSGSSKKGLDSSKVIEGKKSANSKNLSGNEKKHQSGAET